LEACPKGVVEGAGWDGCPNVEAGVVEPKPAAPNLGPEGVEGAPNAAGAGLLNGLLAPPGVGIFEGDVVLAADVADVDVAFVGVTKPG
jgi:hypothetical protein